MNTYYKFTLIIILFGLIKPTWAQQQPNTRNYSKWYTVYEESNGPYSNKIQIAFSLNKCGNEGLIGYSFWKINNDINRENTHLTFKFDYEDCEGKIKHQTVTVICDKVGEDRDLGYWFFGYKVTRVAYDIKFYDPNKGNNSSTGNGLNTNSNNGPNTNSEADRLILDGDKAVNNNQFQEAYNFYNLAKAKGGLVESKIRDAQQKEASYNTQLQAKEKERLAKESAQSLAQLKQTESYLKKRMEIVTQNSNDLQQSIQNFGVAMTKYFDRREENRNRIANYMNDLQRNSEIYANCATGVQMNYMFTPSYSMANSQCLAEPFQKMPPGKEVYDYNGIKDEVDEYYKNGNYSQGVQLIGNFSSVPSKVAISYGNNSAFLALNQLYFWSKYYTFNVSSPYDGKEYSKKLKNIQKGKSDNFTDLGVGIAALFKSNDTELAKLCFNKIIVDNKNSYCKKSALLYLGAINLDELEKDKNPKKIASTLAILQEAFAIKKVEFLSTPHSNHFGSYFFEDYFSLLQIAILQEVAHACYLDYEVNGKQESLLTAYNYYYSFFDSLN
ncbi:MAG: hypothetical protein EOP00_10565 [Pedobacter sp.]|nr:MAG: hypothetical protein EOP00_10565 [Pedobacter sp.]